MTSGQGWHTGINDRFAGAQRLERDEPSLVAGAADDLRAAAEEDHRHGAPRGRAYVRKLQELAVGQPELGIAVARMLGLEHIVEDLLNGISVEGVPGIGPDGAPMPPTSRHRARRRGAWLLATAGLVLLVEAIVAGGLASVFLYAWTAVGLGLFFAGGYLVMLRD